MFQLNELCTEREHLFPLRTHPRKSATSHSGKISSLTPMGRNRRGKKREGLRGGRHLVRELVVPVALPGLRVHFPHPPRTLHGSLLYVLAIVVPYVVLSVLLYGASTQRRRSHVCSLSARFDFSVASGSIHLGKSRIEPSLFVLFFEDSFQAASAQQTSMRSWAGRDRATDTLEFPPGFEDLGAGQVS